MTMRIAKKKGLLICFVMTLLFAVTGCANREEAHGLDQKEPTTITLWHYYNGIQDITLNQLVTEFNNTIGMERGIIVDAQSKSSVDDLAMAVKDSARKAVGAEKLPNIVQTYTDGAIELDEMGIIADFSAYLTQEERAEYMDAYVAAGTFGKNNQWKLFPIAKSTEILALNKNAWDAFSEDTGISTDELATWEGVTKTAQAYYEWSDGESFFGRDAFANYMIVGSTQLGKPIITVENGQASMELDEAVMKKLWDNYYVPYVKGYFKQVGRYRTDDVKIGEIVAIVGATSGMVYFPTEVTKGNEEPQPIDYMILPLPNFEGTQPYMVLQGADMAVLSATETQEYASTLFLQWLTEVEHNTAFAVQAGYLPVKKSANQPGAVTDYIAEHKVVLKQIQQDTIDAALTQIASGELYTLPGFKGGDEVRILLNDSMNQLAISDRATVLKQVEDGIDEERALTPYLSQAYFEAWLADMRQQLEGILSKR